MAEATKCETECLDRSQSQSRSRRRRWTLRPSAVVTDLEDEPQSEQMSPYSKQPVQVHSVRLNGKRGGAVQREIRPVDVTPLDISEPRSCQLERAHQRIRILEEQLARVNTQRIQRPTQEDERVQRPLPPLREQKTNVAGWFSDRMNCSLRTEPSGSSLGSATQAKPRNVHDPTARGDREDSMRGDESEAVSLSMERPSAQSPQLCTHWASLVLSGMLPTEPSCLNRITETDGSVKHAVDRRSRAVSGDDDGPGVPSAASTASHIPKPLGNDDQHQPENSLSESSERSNEQAAENEEIQASPLQKSKLSQAKVKRPVPPMRRMINKGAIPTQDIVVEKKVRHECPAVSDPDAATASLNLFDSDHNAVGDNGQRAFSDNPSLLDDSNGKANSCKSPSHQRVSHAHNDQNSAVERSEGPTTDLYGFSAFAPSPIHRMSAHQQNCYGSFFDPYLYLNGYINNYFNLAVQQQDQMQYNCGADGYKNKRRHKKSSQMNSNSQITLSRDTLIRLMSCSSVDHQHHLLQPPPCANFYNNTHANHHHQHSSHHKIPHRYHNNSHHNIPHQYHNNSHHNIPHQYHNRSHNKIHHHYHKHSHHNIHPLHPSHYPHEGRHIGSPGVKPLSATDAGDRYSHCYALGAGNDLNSRNHSTAQQPEQRLHPANAIASIPFASCDHSASANSSEVPIYINSKV